MPSPETALSTQRPELGASFEEFDTAMDRAGFISARVLPVVEVGKQASSFGKIPIEQLLQSRDTVRAPGSAYARNTYTFKSASYATQENGIEEVVDDRESNMFRDYFDAEMIAAERARDAVLRSAEERAAALIFNSSTWTGSALTTAITDEWDDITSIPITDVEAAILKVYDGSGLWPNALILNRKVFRNLRKVTQILDRIAASGAGFPNRAADITEGMLSAVFDLPFIIVAGSSKNTANEGQAASLSQIWSDEYAMVAKIAVSNDFREPCVGRTFHWGEDGSAIGGQMESYRDETVRGDVIRVRHDVDELVLYAQAAHLISNVTT